MAAAGDMVTKRGSRPVSSNLLLPFPFLLLLTSSSACPRTCDLALGSYYLNVINSAGTELNLTYVSSLFGQTVAEVLSYNPNITNANLIFAGTRLNISFSCDCLHDSFLGHTFSYIAQSKDTYAIIAGLYANLTTVAALEAYNTIPVENITVNTALNVTVNCSCGDPDVSKDYGFFITYPLRSGDSLQSVANASGLSEALIRSFNPGANFNAGEGIVFIPAKDRNGSFRPIQTSNSGLSAGAIGGIVAVVVVALLVVFLCFGVYRRKKWKSHSLLSLTHQDNSVQQDIGLSHRADLDSKGVDFNMEKSIEFTYEELSTATSGFSMSNKIGEGGFGAVFYAELRGEKAAIKKMDMEATREFLAELKVLANVHHLNLVRLIGYCTEGSLFLVYEYIENGNLSQHLRGSRRDPLPWPARVKIALDSARGLEYIHEHTVPVYVHRDIKSANILIDKKFRAKVADFGLTKLTHVGNVSQAGNTKTPTRLVGTFGYMPPEYAQYGEVSPKVDVYAFGVVLFELISAKEAIVKLGSAETKGLISLFDDALSQSNDSDRMDNLLKLVDPRLGDDYPIDSVLEMIQIAKACTHEDPLSRPTMRTIVVALMALSSSTEDWDIRNFHGNDALRNLISGR